MRIYNKRIEVEGKVLHFSTTLEMTIYAVNVLGVQKESTAVLDGIDYALEHHLTDDCYSEFGIMGSYLYTENVRSKGSVAASVVWN